MNSNPPTPAEQLEWIWQNCTILCWPKGNGAAFTLNPPPRIYSRASASAIVEAEMSVKKPKP